MNPSRIFIIGTILLLHAGAYAFLIGTFNNELKEDMLTEIREGRHNASLSTFHVRENIAGNRSTFRQNGQSYKIIDSRPQANGLVCIRAISSADELAAYDAYVEKLESTSTDYFEVNSFLKSRFENEYIIPGNLLLDFGEAKLTVIYYKSKIMWHRMLRYFGADY